MNQTKIPMILSGEASELLRKLTSPESDVREAAFAEFVALGPELKEEIKRLGAISRLDAIRSYEQVILVCAVAEWLKRLGLVAAASLEQLENAFRSEISPSQDLVESALAELVTFLGESPLTSDGVFRQNAAAPVFRWAVGSRGMDSMTADQIAFQLGLSVGEIERRIKALGLPEVQSLDELTDADVRRLRSKNLMYEIGILFDDSESWLDCPNTWLGGESPRELLGTEREYLVSDIVEGLKHGTLA